DGAGVLEHVVRGDDSASVRGIDPAADARRAVAEALVGRMLEGEAAAQPAAEARYAPRAHRELLVLGHAQRDRLLVGREPAAAVLVAAETMVSTKARAL